VGSGRVGVVAGDVVVGGVVAGGVVDGCLAVWWSGGDSLCEKSASRQQLEQQRRFQKNLNFGSSV
jgi:hypothetical protein